MADNDELPPPEKPKLPKRTYRKIELTPKEKVAAQHLRWRKKLQVPEAIQLLNETANIDINQEYTNTQVRIMELKFKAAEAVLRNALPTLKSYDIDIHGKMESQNFTNIQINFSRLPESGVNQIIELKPLEDIKKLTE